MNKTLAVVRREFTSRVRTKAFVISTLLMPVLLVVVFGAQILLLTAGTDRTQRIALIDASGQDLGDRIAAALTAETLGSGDAVRPRYDVTQFTVAGDTTGLRDELVARVDAADKDAEGYNGVLVVAADALASGTLRYYGDNVGSMTAMEELRGTLSGVLAGERLGALGLDMDVVTDAIRPAQLRTTKVSGGHITDQSGVASFAIAYAMGFILYIAILIYGQQTMTSVIEEKTSRIMEVLTSSLTPFQMLLGKVIGVGAVGLLQMGIWAGSALLLTSQATRLASLAGMDGAALAVPSLSTGLIIVFLVYFVIGFLLYGALFAAIGSMCNTVQETQQYATVVTMIILVALFAVFGLINDPTGPLAKLLSLLPFLSPFTMPVRWSMTSVPLAQLLLSLTLSVLALWLCVWLAARIYRTGILMYGKKPSVRELWRWLRAG